MEVVNTLEIDGTQWEIQDAEARNKIVHLEEEVNINIPKRFTTDEKRIDNVYKYAEGKTIQECCNKLNYSYEKYDITFAINTVFMNSESYPTGIYSIAVGGPAYLIIVQRLSDNFMSVIATGYSISHILKATKSNGIFSLGVITPTNIIS